jgi:hypothetical protein
MYRNLSILESIITVGEVLLKIYIWRVAANILNKQSQTANRG